MTRRKRDYKRVFNVDSVYKSVHITRFINKVMIKGKKSLAEKIVYSALEKLSKEVSVAPLEAFNMALKNVTPVMEVKSRRVGGSTYQVPVEVRSHRGNALAIKWIISHSRNKSGKTMTDNLANELIEAFKGLGASVKKKEETHKMAESNKAFAHFRW